MNATYIELIGGDLDGAFAEVVLAVPDRSFGIARWRIERAATTGIVSMHDEHRAFPRYARYLLAKTSCGL